ncbi:MAG: hypothetical protein ACRBEQ_10110 [Hyphomonas sp.]
MTTVGSKSLLLSMPTETRVAQTVASLACAALRDDIQAHGRASLVTSASSDVEGILPFLFAETIDWTRVSVGLVASAVQTGAPSGASWVEIALRASAAGAAAFVPMGGRSCDPEVDTKLADDAYLTQLPFSFSLLTLEDDGSVPGWGDDHRRFSGETDQSVDWRSVEDATPGAYQLALTRAALSRSRRAALVLKGDVQCRAFELEMQQYIYQAPIRGIVEDLGARMFIFNSPG